MNTNRGRKPGFLFVLWFALAMLGCGSQGWAESPFSEEPLRVSPAAGPTQAEPDKPGLLDRLAGKAGGAYRRLASGLNKVLVDQDPPAFVARSARIPGHDGREFVCQGICYLPDRVVSPAADQSRPRRYRYALLSYYPEAGQTDEPSQLVVVEIGTGRALRRFRLFQAEGDAYTGHAGGVAVAGRYVWVASGFKIYGFDLQQILDFLNDPTARPAQDHRGVPPSLRIPAFDLVAARRFGVDSKASFLSFDGTQLWVGDFVKSSDGDFAPVAHHTQNPFKLETWIAGYKVDANGLPTAVERYSFRDGEETRTVHKPDRLIFCRESVQGMALCGSSAALSVSYGPRNSKLALYRSPLAQAPTRISFKPAGQRKTFTADGWVLADGVNWRKTVELPAGSEDLEFDGAFLYVTFEGASPNYRTRWISINPRIAISDRFYLIDPAAILK